MTAPIAAAQKELTDKIIGLPGIVGTAIGERAGTPCIMVYLSREDTALRERIPQTVRGFPIEIAVMGEITPR